MSKVRSLQRRQRRQQKVPGLVFALIAMALKSATKIDTTTNGMSIFPNNNRGKVPRVNEWKVSPEDGTLTGIVKGHPILEDGDEITTSPLTNPDFAEDGEGAIVTTMSGTKYKLEKPKDSDISSRKKYSPLMGLFRYVEKTDSQSSKKIGTEPIIDDWKVDARDGRILGTVTGHAMLPDGDLISVSPPIQKNIQEGSIITTENGSRYKLKTPRKKNIYSNDGLLFRKPQPPTLEMTQQEVDNQLAKLDGIAPGSTGRGSDESTGGSVLGAVAAAGVASVVGLNSVNDSNSISIANFDNNVDDIKKKVIVENNRYEAIAQLSQQQNEKSILNANGLKRIDKGESKEKNEKEYLLKRELVPLQKQQSDQGRLERNQKEQDERVFEQNELIRHQEREREEGKAEKERLQQPRQLERRRRLEEEETAWKEIQKTQEERQQRQVQLEKLLQERERARLRLEAAEYTKREAERKVAANQKAKTELKQRQEELESLRKEREQQKQLILLHRQKEQEQNQLAKEKSEQQKAIEIVNKEAKEAKALAKDLNKRLESEEQFNAIQTVAQGIVGSGLIGTAGFVTSFEIRRRLSEESIEKISKLTEPTDSSMKNTTGTLGNNQMSSSPSRLPPRNSYATNIRETLKFVNEIDDLLAEVEDVLAEVNNKTADVNNITSENMAMRLSTDTTSQIPLEPSLEYLADDTKINPKKKRMIKESHLPFKYVMSDNDVLQEEYVLDPADTCSAVGQQEIKSSSDGPITPQGYQGKVTMGEEELSFQAEAIAEKNGYAPQINIGEDPRLQELPRIDAEFEEHTSIKDRTVPEVKEGYIEAEVAKLQDSEERKAHTEVAMIKKEGPTQIRDDQEIRVGKEGEEAAQFQIDEKVVEAGAEFKTEEAAQLQIREESGVNMTKEAFLHTEASQPEPRKDYLADMKAARNKVEEEKFEIENEAIHLEETAQLQLENEAESVSEPAKIQATEEAMTKAEKKIKRKEGAQGEAEMHAREQIEPIQINAEKARINVEEADRIKAEKESRNKIEEEIRLELEDNAQSDFELRMKENSSMQEKVSQKLLLQRPKEQKNVYDELFEDRAMAERDLAAEELKIVEENEEAITEEQNDVRSERENCDITLYEARRKMLEKRVKEQRLSFEPHLERKRFFQEKEELTRRKMLAARLQTQKEDARFVIQTKNEEFKVFSERAREEMLKSRLKDQAIQLEMARLKAEEEAKAKEKEEARLRAEKEAKAKAEKEKEVRLKAEEEAKAKEKEEARLRAEKEAKAKAEKEKEVRLKAEEEAKAKAEEEATLKAEKEAKAKAEEEARLRVEEETKAKAEEEAKAKGEGKAKLKAEEEAKAKAEKEVRLKAEKEAKAKAEEEARIQQQARLKVEEEGKAKAEEEVKLKAEDEARLKAEEEAHIKAEEQIRLEEEKLRAKEAARVEEEIEVKVKAEEQICVESEDDAKSKTEADVCVNLEEAKMKGGKTKSKAEDVNEKAEEASAIKAEEEEKKAKVKLDEGKTKAGKVVILKGDEEETEAKIGTDTNIKFTEAKLKAENEDCIVTDEKDVIEGEEESVLTSIQHNSGEKGRLSELERLERDFGLINSVAVLKDNVEEAESLDPGAEYQTKEFRKVNSIFSDECGSEAMEEMKKKYESVKRQQTKITSRLSQLEKVKGTKLEEKIGDLKQSCFEGSKVTGEEESHLEKKVPTRENNIIDDEARKLADTVTKRDKLYIPSKKVLANTALLLQEIAGPSLENHSKEQYISEREVGVHAGNTLKVPVRISTPGSIVEFSIENKSHEFLFGISAFMDEGQVAKIKKMSPFKTKTDTQKIVVPAGNAPCTMQFAFTSNGSTLLESVRFGYEIRVIPPSLETIKLGRIRRTQSSLEILESELSSQREILETTKVSLIELDRDVAQLQTEINEKSLKLESIRVEEERRKKEVSAAPGQSLTQPRFKTDKYFNDFR